MDQVLCELAARVMLLLAQHPRTLAAIAATTLMASTLIVCRAVRRGECKRSASTTEATWRRQLTGWIGALLGAVLLKITAVVASAVALTVATAMGWIQLISDWIVVLFIYYGLLTLPLVF